MDERISTLKENIDTKRSNQHDHFVAEIMEREYKRNRQRVEDINLVVNLYEDKLKAEGSFITSCSTGELEKEAY